MPGSTGGEPSESSSEPERQDLAQRYGGRAGPRPRWWTAMIWTAAIVLAGLVAVLAYRNLGDAPISADVTGYQTLDDSTMRVSFTVTRDDPSQAAVCVIRARSRDGDEAGRREVYVPGGGSTITSLSTRLRSSKRPVAGDVFGCSENVPPYLPREATGR